MTRSLPMYLALLGAASIAACAHSEPMLGHGREIDEIQFIGNKRLSKARILEHLRAGESNWIPLLPDYPYDEALLDADFRRIEALYRAYGYHEARVVSHEVHIEDEDEVRLVITIEEGPVTTIEHIDYVWATDTEERLTEPIRAKLEAAAKLRVGAPFEIPRLNAGIGSIRQALHVRGHPLATVDGRADVRTDLRTAVVTVEINPGPFARIAKVRVEGLYDVPEYMVRREFRFAVGKPYSPALVKQVEHALNAMRVFRWVAAAPVREVRDGEMELLMRVSEADPHRLRLGTLVEFQSARWQQQVSADYTNTNLFGHLTRLDLELIAGYAELPEPFNPDQTGPVLAVRPTFTKKGLIEDHLIWTEAPHWRMDVHDGYQFHSPSNRFGVSRWFFGALNVGLSHNVEYVDFFNLVPSFEANSSLLGLDFRDPFILSYVQAKATLFVTDSIVAPRNGVVFEAIYDIAGGPFAGDYDFHKLEGVVRGYWRISPPLQLAARFGTGVILPYGAQAGAPFSHKFYLGGADSVRGWGPRRLSPRLDECDDNGENCDSIPIGGLTMLQGNLELRMRTIGDLYVVGFADMGDVQSAETTFEPSEWNYSAGPGLRYDSPIGVIRTDVGFRLNDPGIYDESRWAFYFGFGETF